MFLLCENVLKNCVADSLNVCYSEDDNGGYIYDPASRIWDFFLYNFIFLVGQGYVVAQREFFQRISNYRDTQVFIYYIKKFSDSFVLKIIDV